MSVKQCQIDVDSAEFSEWIAFNNIYPFTIDRAEYAISVLSALTANINSKKTYTYKDFLLQREDEEKDPETIFNTLKAAFDGSHQ